ncbi:hypothetical protein DOTSEDRAFT_43614 [Dothistroma septosporum NZE10]|uniref:Uncharacterized protein n=1 Tax=Dothistroma septosporum (strain NZE10 / CBS 128990) TaxID=675120 RepID=N1PSA2_DOTSN|nr:hypothetical protein DOTSEDRAFT_43614 [Dothistroma septosporum NZE10]
MVLLTSRKKQSDPPPAAEGKSDKRTGIPTCTVCARGLPDSLYFASRKIALLSASRRQCRLNGLVSHSSTSTTTDFLELPSEPYGFTDAHTSPKDF